MSLTYTLELYCHVRPGPDAELAITIDGDTKNFVLPPTINWVASTTSQNGNKILIDLPLTVMNSIFVKNKQYTTQDFDFEISAKNNDVLIGGYVTSMPWFNIVTQPVWNDPEWQPYLLNGHIGEEAQFQGPGSLQVLEGQTVKFKGQLTFFDPNLGSSKTDNP